VFEINCAWPSVAKSAMGFDESYRTLRSIIPDPQDPEKEITKDYKVYAAYLHVSEVLAVMTSNDPVAKFISDDGVIPLRGETPEDVDLLVKWLTREKGFQISVTNVLSLIRLADKFDIEYLANEIKIFAAHWVTQVAPSYDLWELAASHEIDCLEQHCRLAARRKADEIFSKGDGISYFLNRGIPNYMVDRMIRALFLAREAVIATDYKGVKTAYL